MFMNITTESGKTLWAVALPAQALNVSLYHGEKLSDTPGSWQLWEKKKKPKHQVSDQGKNEVINVQNTARNIKQETVDTSFSFKTFSKFVFFSPWLSKPGSKY